MKGTSSGSQPSSPSGSGSPPTPFPPVSSSSSASHPTGGSSAKVSSNGVGKTEKKTEMVEIFKKYFKTLSTPSGNRIGNQFWPILSLLRFGGYLPLTIDEKKEIFATTNIWSLPTLAMGCMGSLIIFWWMSIIYQAAFDPTVELLKSTSAQTPFARMNAVLQPTIQISEVICGWLTCKLLAEYMNNWQNFETKFNTVFKDVNYKYKLNVRRFRDFLCIFYVVFPALFFIQHQDYITWRSLEDHKSVWTIILSTLVTFCVVIFSFMEDVKVLLMYRVAQENFRETRNGIIAQYKTTATVTKTPLGPEKVKQWIKLLNMIRNQHKISCEIQAPQQIISIILSILILSSNLFLFIQSLVDYSNQKTPISFLPLGAFVLILFRFFLKCVMAEKVTDEEQSIAQELIQMESSGANIFIKMELKFMYDLIVSKPTVTNFANVFTMNKALAQQVLGHVITCLIILMQFNLSIMVEAPLMY